MTSDFYYKKGQLETSIPWNQPSQEAFKLWLIDFLSFTEIKKYKVFLCGGFLEKKWETWDIDIVLTGPVSIQDLERLLIDGEYLALYKYNILVDIQHYKKLVWPFEKKRTVEKIVPYNKIIKNSMILTDLSSNPTLEKLSDFLWRIKKIEPSDKQISRIQKGYIYKRPVLLTK